MSTCTRDLEDNLIMCGRGGGEVGKPIMDLHVHPIKTFIFCSSFSSEPSRLKGPF